MNAIRQLFAKKHAAPAPVERATRLTCGQLSCAIKAARAPLDPTSSTVKTLECLYELTAGYGVEREIVKLNNNPPVTLLELDAVLASIRKPEFGMTASTIGALTKLRALLATHGRANAHAAEPVQYLTVAQAKALVVEMDDKLTWVLGAVTEEFSLGSPSRSHLLDLLGRSANGSPAREKLLREIQAFKAADVPPRTQAEWLRYQATGKWS